MRHGKNLLVGMLLCMVGLVGLLSAGRVEAAPGGIPTCTQQLNTCTANLNTCTTVTNRCTTSLNSCTSSLSATQGNLATCNTSLTTCNGSLTTCQADLTACEADLVVFPGDGVTGPALSYTDNGNGTFTDNNTKLVWEKKDTAAGVHDVGNIYPWSSTGTAADGSLFTTFLATLNNKCDGNETTACTTNAQCTGIGNGLCGHAGHRDWRIPNVKELQSIVDYSTFGPAVNAALPGSTAASFYWSSTSFANGPGFAWDVFFNGGDVSINDKSFNAHARAVRGGS